jgi:hypothetical protein
MKRRVFESWLLLLYVDCVMSFHGFPRVHEIVRKRLVRARQLPAVDVSELCRGMDLACVFYVKRVLCMQRSGATTLLLRRYGQRAEMIIGVQLIPFRSHAWVEIDGHVVNDKPYMRLVFQELERC